MLKFLDNRQAEVAYRSPKRYQPEMIYGISCQAPAEFQHPHTILFRKSYMNPYLELEPQRKAIAEKEQIRKHNPRQFAKHNPIYAEEQRVVGQPRPDDNEVEKFRKSYMKELGNSPIAFRHTRGPFGDFVEKNDRYKSVGPLLGKERSNESMMATRKSLYEKSRQSLYERTQNSQVTGYLNHRRRSLNHNESFISRNSRLFSKTTKLREERNRFNSEVKNLLQQRKTSDRFTITAAYFPTIGKIYSDRYEKDARADQDSVQQQEKDYEEYERIMARRLHI